MRGQIVEQIKIIHFRGGEVKWGLTLDTTNYYIP